MDRPSGSSRLAAIALLLVFLVGAAFRLSDLGVVELDADEMNHHFAASAIEKGDGPVLPSGHAYERGIDYTRLVAATRAVEEDPERAARLPSALFGVLNLALVALVAWRVGGAWTAVWATALLAIYPEAVIQSRTSRFYTYQLVFGIAALGFGWLALRESGRRVPSPGAERLAWIGTLGAAVALLLGARIQLTTVAAGAGLGVAFALAGVADLVARGRRAWRDSVPLRLTAAAAVLVVAALAVRPSLLGNALEAATFVPLWARSDPGHPLGYYYRLVDDFPWIVALLPVIAIVAAMRRPALAAYLLVWWGVPFLLHSFVLTWKAERYMLLAAPGLFILTGLAASELFGHLRRHLVGMMERSHVPQPRALASAAVGMAAVGLLVTTPAFSAARKASAGKRPETTTNWMALREVLREQPDGACAPVGTSEPLGGLFYLGRLDFTVQTGLLETPGTRVDERHLDLTRPVSDFYSGTPVVVTPQAIRRAFPRAEAVYVGVDSSRVRFGLVNRTLLDTLAVEGEELCKGRCGPMALYRWPLDGSAPTPAPIEGPARRAAEPAAPCAMKGEGAIAGGVDTRGAA